MESIDDFSYFNCPECSFKTKDKSSFKSHGQKNHPLSSVLFGTPKVITFSSGNDLVQLTKIATDQKCKDLASKLKLKGIQLSMTTDENDQKGKEIVLKDKFMYKDGKMEKIIKCSVCDENFSTDHDMRSHLESTHFQLSMNTMNNSKRKLEVSSKESVKHPR